jgi:hypothetical protein
MVYTTANSSIGRQDFRQQNGKWFTQLSIHPLVVTISDHKMTNGLHNCQFIHWSSRFQTTKWQMVYTIVNSPTGRQDFRPQNDKWFTQLPVPQVTVSHCTHLISVV